MIDVTCSEGVAACSVPHERFAVLERDNRHPVRTPAIPSVQAWWLQVGRDARGCEGPLDDIMAARHHRPGHFSTDAPASVSTGHGGD